MTEDKNGGVTKPITETVKALAGTPTLLVLVILNVLILGMITYLLKTRADHLQAERTETLQLLESCLQKLDSNGIKL